MNLEWAKQFLGDKWHNVYYIAIYWSQNYNLDTPESDYDYKAIIIPTLDEIIANSHPFSSCYEFEGGQIDVKDIRCYLENAVKCNINFIEILNTRYFLWETLIRSYFIPLQKEMGQLFLRACHGMMLEKEKALRHPYPGIIKKIKKFGYDPKQLHHIARLRILMERFVSWNVGDYQHEWPQKEFLLSLKSGGILNEDVDAVVEGEMLAARNIRDGYKVGMKFDAKKSLIDLGRNIIRRSIIENLW